MRPDFGFSAGEWKYLEKRRLRPTLDVKRAGCPENSAKGEGAPIPPPLGSWYGPRNLHAQSGYMKRVAIN